MTLKSNALIDRNNNLLYNPFGLSSLQHCKFPVQEKGPVNMRTGLCDKHQQNACKQPWTTSDWHIKIKISYYKYYQKVWSYSTMIRLLPLDDHSRSPSLLMLAFPLLFRLLKLFFYRLNPVKKYITQMLELHCKSWMASHLKSWMFQVYCSFLSYMNILFISPFSDL